MRLGCIGIGSNAIRLLVAAGRTEGLSTRTANAGERACLPGWSGEN